MTLACVGPSPNTVCVPRTNSSHALQPFAIALTTGRVGFGGRSSETGSPGFGSDSCAFGARGFPSATKLLHCPRHVLGNHRIGARFLALLLERGGRLGVAGIAERDGKIPPQPADAGALHRAALEQRSQVV